MAANGPDAISSALKEAKDKGVKIVYVEAPVVEPSLQPKMPTTPWVM